MVNVRVSGKTYPIRGMLWKSGLRYQGGSLYTGDVSESEADWLRKHLPKNVRVRVIDNFSRRSSDYRKVFFETHSPQIGRYYVCAYCGRLLKRKDVTVDHIIPVVSVQTDKRLKNRLKGKGYESVNDPDNLVAACERCNKRKGQKRGSWIFRGKIGRYAGLWIVRKVLRAVLFFTTVIFILWCIRYPDVFSDAIMKTLDFIPYKNLF